MERKSRVTTVFVVSGIITGLFTIWGLFPESVLGNATLLNVTSTLQGWLSNGMGWFYLLSATGFLLVSVFLIFSRYGSIRLGKDMDRPEFSYLSWFAMLFSAGMGIGLIFWGAAEPLLHFHSPPFASPTPEGDARTAMRYAFFHWGLHPWAIYAMIALAIAYSTFRKGRPATIGETIGSLVHNRYEQPVKQTVDILAVIATAFGVATSLGFGAQQIAGGLHYLIPGVPNAFVTQLIIIAVVTVLYMISASTGLDKGIRILSNTNIFLAIVLLVATMFAGPTAFIFDLFTQTVGTYLQQLPSMSFRTAAFEPVEREWINGWTIFYWAWWISWSPFVGTFIARVSKGRTIREFIIGILLVPTSFGLLWFSVFGGSAIWADLFGGYSLIDQVNEIGTEVGLFALFETFGGFGTLLSVIAIFLISTFFITSADSATYVLGMLTSNGKLIPPMGIKMTWGIIQSSIAAVLLYAGGLDALQAVAILVAFPFIFVLIFMLIALFKDLADEPDERDKWLETQKKDEDQLG
ncbi:BCCT family transporter [Exiguobacterium sp. s154]|uniref:BCCT family transporter n=1 Tax=Exiguobacterium sp. s154 TaxID=2751277 RepID=UPI001BE90A7C|nr:BCCT family transporter [Exiguobacterium sp. s154]